MIATASEHEHEAMRQTLQIARQLISQGQSWDK